MKEITETFEIFYLGQRVQHFLFIAAFTLSFLSGVALPTGTGVLYPAVKFFLDADVIFWWHAFFGLLAAAVLVGHLLYLAVRSYIEGIPFTAFPLLPTAGDLGRLVPEAMGFLLGRGGERNRYTPWRKAFYWVSLFGSASVVVSGVAVRYWDRWDTPLITSHLGALAVLHGGGAFLLAVLALWHVEAIVDGGRRTPLAMVALTGKMKEKDLEDIYPRECARLREARELEREKFAEADQERRDERQRTEERAMVEEMLERGNRLAREGALPEAIAEYRLALESFPTYSQAQYNLALVLERVGRKAEALDAYRRFLEIDNFHPLAEKVRAAVARLEKET